MSNRENLPNKTKWSSWKACLENGTVAKATKSSLSATKSITKKSVAYWRIFCEQETFPLQLTRVGVFGVYECWSLHKVLWPKTFSVVIQFAIVVDRIVVQTLTCWFRGARHETRHQVMNVKWLFSGSTPFVQGSPAKVRARNNIKERIVRKAAITLDCPQAALCFFNQGWSTVLARLYLCID